MMPCLFLLVVLLTGSLCCGPARADDYLDARSDLVAAYSAKDFAAMQAAAARALAARPGYPAGKYNLALAQALSGNAPAALATLLELAAAGIDFDVGGAPEFAAVESLPGWADYEAMIASINVPAGDAKVAFQYDVGDFVPEGIAIDSAGRLYLGSIRHGTIVRIAGEPEILSDGTGHWSVFGMRLDGRDGLWFASACVPEFAGDSKDSGRTGLFHLDLDSGQLDTAALLPDSEDAQVLGDLVLLDDQTILATESLTGRLYRYAIDTGTFHELVAPGSLRSMQGLVLGPDGQHLYVADYVGGLFRIAIDGSAIERVEADDTVSLFGIDGLYRHGRELVAIQNGIRPQRITGLLLSDDGLRITASRVLARKLDQFDEPTLGTISGDDFYFVANSHWNRFDARHALPDDLDGPIVMQLSLLP